MPVTLRHKLRLRYLLAVTPCRGHGRATAAVDVVRSVPAWMLPATVTLSTATLRASATV